ncbi:GYDIA family GHMP kinase [Moheibacter sediminis]|uniref:Mevalonate kinase n=1 Tax=Moheibacter sediminis TaxID=1434700 RepID=A0A1W1ZSI8_9FLAO|nr:GYDIA family GHMP kinase [Moheibacter sediminis]SMC51377.1 Mevalonate kinase [Moheibacter sediminis]
MNSFRANGKLYIAGEYTVLDGGLSFAIPTKLGQILEVDYLEESENPTLIWEAFLEDGSLWFSAEFELKTLGILNASEEKLTQKLKELFRAIEKLNPNFFKKQTQNIHCKTQLEFKKEWGLGSSSTLIYLLAKFSGVDEFELSDLTFKTSGYDVACASQNSSIYYQILDNQRRIEPVEFNPDFLDKLHFVYLNQKQDTQIGVSKQYKSKPKNQQLVDAISILTQKIVESDSLCEFESYIDQHENLLSQHMEVPKAKDLYFSDYSGSVKSLGAWGGDFVMVTERENYKEYFQSRGYNTIFSYKEIMIQK